MNTAFLLMAQYDGKPIIPIDDVCRDYFFHLTPTKLIRKISAGEISDAVVNGFWSKMTKSATVPASLEHYYALERVNYAKRLSNGREGCSSGGRLGWSHPAADTVYTSLRRVLDRRGPPGLTDV